MLSAPMGRWQRILYDRRTLNDRVEEQFTSDKVKLNLFAAGAAAIYGSTNTISDMNANFFLDLNPTSAAATALHCYLCLTLYTPILSHYATKGIQHITRMNKISTSPSLQREYDLQDQNPPDASDSQ